MVRGLGGAGPEGAPGLVWRPGPRPAPLGRPPGAYIWRAFPPETSGLATRPRRGLAPRRPGGWERLLLCERQRFAQSNRPSGPSLLTRSMRVQNYLGALASCAVRERQVARPVARRVHRRRAARPTGPPILVARSCGARRHLHTCGSEHQRPPGRRRLCRVLLALLLELPVWRRRRHRRV
jgi:hypothetical protein